MPAVRFGLAFLALLLLIVADAQAAPSRIKDLIDVEGVRENQLVGYGLVVGLNGTGDKLKDGSFTKQSLQSMLNRLGVKPTDKGTTSKNVAAVMVTAALPPFARHGARLDVTVSALGDAQSLLGGTLLVTPLLGADGEVYAVAQGQIGVAGFAAKGQAESIVKGVPTNGRIPDGAIVEREVGYEMARMQALTLTLRSPDFTTARRIAQAINAFLGEPAARPTDNSTVAVEVPDAYDGSVVNLVTDIEQLRDRARSAGPRAHRRGLRHHRHGRERARLHGRHRPGQPDHPHHRDAAGVAAAARSATARPSSCRAPISRWTSRATASSACWPAASPCRSWSTA